MHNVPLQAANLIVTEHNERVNRTAEVLQALKDMLTLWANTQPVLGKGRRNIEHDSQVIAARAVIAKG